VVILYKLTLDNNLQPSL